MLNIEQAPEPWSYEQHELYNQAQLIMQEVAAYFNNVSRQREHLHRIKKIAGYFLLTNPATNHFTGGHERSINDMPGFPTAWDVEH